MSGSTIMIHVDEEGLRGEVRVLNPMASEGPRAEPLLELTFQAGRERVSLLWRGKGAIGEARAILRGMELLAGKIEADAQEVREQEAEAASSEAQEGAQAPLAASEGHGRAGGGALGALEGSEGPSRGILATPAEEARAARRIAELLRPEGGKSAPAPEARVMKLTVEEDGRATITYVKPPAPWAGTDRECPDCGGLRPLWHEPDCHVGALRKAREVSE